MTLGDFEQHVNETILAWGVEYFRRGCVLSLEEEEEGEWTAEVEGGEAYFVTVTLFGNTVREMECDCPYDWGPCCKHQVAVLYALREAITAPARQAPPIARAGKSLRDVLGGLDHQTLVSLLLEYAQSDKQLKEALLLRFVEDADSAGAARKLMRAAARAAGGRHGYIEYGDVHRVSSAGETVLDNLDALVEQGRVLPAARACVALLEESMEILGMCDDSNGEVGGVISRGIMLLEGLAEDMLPGDADMEVMFALLFEHALSPIYSGWADWRHDLLGACLPLCAHPSARARMEAYLADTLATLDSDDFSTRYDRKALETFQHTLLARFDGEEAAAAYLEQRLDNDHFREHAIRQALEEGDFDRAWSLCLQGEEKDAAYAGLVTRWQRYRYEAAKGLGDMQAQKELMRGFTLSGDFEAYLTLKALYGAAEWPTVAEGVLDALRESRHRSMYVDVLVHEGDISRLLAYCQVHPEAITRLYPHLLPTYREAVEAIFLGLIEREAARASSRSHYRAVCDIIRHYRDACGADRAAAIIQKLREAHKRQPAFQDELNNITTG